MTASKSLRVLGLALVGVLASLPGPSAQAEDKVVAKVNGKSITETDLGFADSELGGELANMPPEVRRRYLVEYLVETSLFSDAALSQKLDAGPEFEQRLAYMRQRALRQAFLDKTVNESVSEAAAKSYYDAQVSRMQPQDEVQARHILVQTEEQAKELADKIAKGADFAELAKESSGDAGSKADGGNLGYFSRGQMVPQFEEAAFAMKKGDVSKPIKTQFGWHLIKVEDRRQKPPPSFEEVKDQILGALRKSKIQSLVAAMKGKAQVEYVDPDVKRLVEEDAAKQALFDEEMKKQMEKLKAAPPAGEPAKP